MPPSVAALLALGIPVALIAVSGIVVARTRLGGSTLPSRPVPFGWRVLGGFSPYLFLVGVLALYVWFRGLLGLQRHTEFGSWFVLAIGVVLTVVGVVGYTGYVRRRRAARRSMG